MKKVFFAVFTTMFFLFGKMAAAQTLAIEAVDRTVSLDNSMSAGEIQDVIDSVGRFIYPGATVTFQFADGTYTLSDTLEFSGFFGGGHIVIQGNINETNAEALHTTQSVFLDFSAQQVYGVRVSDTSVASVTVRNLKVKIGYTTATSHGAIAFSGVQSLSYAKYNYVLGTSTNHGRGFKNLNSPIIRLDSNYAGYLRCAANTTGGGMILSEDTVESGTNVLRNGLCAEGGIIQKFIGLQPNSIYGDTESLGGKIF